MGEEGLDEASTLDEINEGRLIKDSGFYNKLLFTSCLLNCASSPYDDRQHISKNKRTAPVLQGVV